MKKIFLDANILIDLIDSNREKHLGVVDFISNNIGSFFYTSCDILTTIYYIASKNNSKILDNLYHILKLVKIIYFSNELAFKTIEIMKEDKKFKDFEDALQYMLAKSINVDFIVTNDKKFYSPDIKIISI